MMKLPCLLLLVLSQDLAAQAINVRDTVYLRVPISMLPIRPATALRGDRMRADVTRIGGSIAINGDTTWRTTRLPNWIPLRLTKLDIDKNKTKAEVDLDFGEYPASRVELRIPSLTPDDIATLVIPRSGLDAAREAAYRDVAAAAFVGPLAAIPEEQQRALLEFATVAASATRLSSEVFREATYLVVDLGLSGAVYNDARLNENQRLAMVLNERLLTISKAFARPVADVPLIHGLKVEMTVLHRNFVTTPPAPIIEDRLQIYFPAELIRKFTNLDITSQELIDGSTVVLNGNRVKVDLQAS